jgi:tRNA pseudouridine32 synthase/23S rRNA pseudouridine746 synthase
MQGRRFFAPLQLLARAIAFEDPLTGEARSFASERELDWP